MGDPRGKKMTLELDYATYCELASQARSLGYPSGWVCLYLHDRAVQLAEPEVVRLLPPVVPSRPDPPHPPWFVRDCDSNRRQAAQRWSATRRGQRRRAA